MSWVLTSGDFNTRGFKVFRVAWSSASPLTELLQVLFLIEDTPGYYQTINSKINQSSSGEDIAKSKTYHQAQMKLRVSQGSTILFHDLGWRLKVIHFCDRNERAKTLTLFKLISLCKYKNESLSHLNRFLDPNKLYVSEHINALLKIWRDRIANELICTMIM